MPVVRIASVNSLTEGGTLSAECGDRQILLCRHEGRIHALDGLCPHRSGPLGQGAFSDGRIVCPWHAWEFDCVTGEYDFDPSIRLTRYPVRVEGGEILVELPADA